ncbi:MAG: hypothetical protein JW717_08410, partial [Marinilabiliaceae bacterium]|nr:hypothetical protein [Marinilabiliaceae bacterium]
MGLFSAITTAFPIFLFFGYVSCPSWLRNKIFLYGNWNNISDYRVIDIIVLSLNIQSWTLLILIIFDMTFKGNEANIILSGILLLLILLIFYKEIGYKRSQRFNWSLAIIPTPGLTCKLDKYFSTSINDEFNPSGISYGDESTVISDRQYYYSGYNKRDILLYPDSIEIKWLILEERSYWEAKVELPKGYAKNHIGAPYISAQFFSGGVVTLYIGDIEEEKRTTLVSVQGKNIPSFEEGYSLYEDCVLPVTTQIEIASNCF